MDDETLPSQGPTAASPWADEPPGGWAAELGVPFLEIHDLLPSTNDHLRRLAGSNLPFFTTIVTRSQSQGRGREGKRWYSAHDAGLWISVLLPADLGARGAGAGVLPLAVGIAAARSMEEVSGMNVGLKWPNDLFLSGKKCGGILCEVVAKGRAWGGEVMGSGEQVVGTREGWGVVAGVGINLRRPGGNLPEELEEGVSFLEEESGGSISEPRLAAALLRELRKWNDPMPNLLEGDLRQEWERRDVLRGRTVRILGGEEFVGVARGIAAGGALLLERPGMKVEEVRSGTVRTMDSETP